MQTYTSHAAYHAAYAHLVQRAANVAHSAAARHSTPQALRYAYLAQRKANGMRGKPNGCPNYSLAMAVNLAHSARRNAPLSKQQARQANKGKNWGLGATNTSGGRYTAPA